MTHEPKPGRQPLLWATLFFSAGLWIGARAWRPATWWIIAILAFALAAAWFLGRRSWMAKGLSLGMWFLLGALLIQIRSTPKEDSRILEFADGREVTITGHVLREKYARVDGPRSVGRQIDIETENIETSGERATIRGGVRLTIYEVVAAETGEAAAIGEPTSAAKAGVDSAAVSARLKSCPPQNLSVGVLPEALQCGVTYGSRLRVRGKLHLPRNYRNPGAFDYESYLRDNGIAVLGSARAQDVERLPGFVGNRIELWRTHIHASLVAKIHELWPTQQAALLDAMVLGEDAFLEGGTRTEFQRSGTYHVLVVSGMNLSILAFVIFWTLRQFHLDQALAGVVTVVLSLAYAFVTGVGPPVWRAALMLADLSWSTLLVSRAQHAQCAGCGGSGGSDLRSACSLWREFSTDLSVGTGHCCYWHTCAGANNATVFARVAAAASYKLRPAPSAGSCAVPARPASDRRAAEEVHRSPAGPDYSGQPRADHAGRL